MILETKKQEVIAAIEQLEDAQLLAQIEELLKGASEPKKRLREPGFARDGGFWMSADFDEPLEDMEEYI